MKTEATQEAEDVKIVKLLEQVKLQVRKSKSAKFCSTMPWH